MGFVNTCLSVTVFEQLLKRFLAQIHTCCCDKTRKLLVENVINCPGTVNCINFIGCQVSEFKNKFVIIFLLAVHTYLI